MEQLSFFTAELYLRRGCGAVGWIIKDGRFTPGEKLFEDERQNIARSLRCLADAYEKGEWPFGPREVVP